MGWLVPVAILLVVFVCGAGWVSLSRRHAPTKRYPRDEGSKR